MIRFERNYRVAEIKQFYAGAGKRSSQYPKLIEFYMILGEVSHVVGMGPPLAKAFGCDECTYSEKSKYAVARHKRVAHKKSSYSCKYCGRVWPTSKRFNGHISIKGFLH